MKIVLLNLADRGYRIYIDNGLLTKVGSLLHPWRAAPRLVVISSRPILDLHGRALHRSLSEAGLSHEILEIADGERYKTLSTLESVYKKLAGLGVTRQTVLVALGGGVVGDVAGFAAASYLRGLPYIQIPTTLVAQIDSAIGGKTGVNLSNGKKPRGRLSSAKGRLRGSGTASHASPPGAGLGTLRKPSSTASLPTAISTTRWSDSIGAIRGRTRPAWRE